MQWSCFIKPTSTMRYYFAIMTVSRVSFLFAGSQSASSLCTVQALCDAKSLQQWLASGLGPADWDQIEWLVILRKAQHGLHLVVVESAGRDATQTDSHGLEQ